jgi:serine/threonine protein kinase
MRDDENEPAEGSLRERRKVCQQAGLPGIPVNELVRYVREVAECLDALHGQGVVYRDVKPDNIVVVKGHAKLTDAGMLQPPLGALGGAGTPAYMAPEVWRGRSGAPSDQYSLALSYAEMRLGRRAVSGRDLVEVMCQHLEGTPDLAALPKAEQQVLLRALAKEPGQRYPSCVRFAHELERVVGP